MYIMKPVSLSFECSKQRRASTLNEITSNRSTRTTDKRRSRIACLILSSILDVLTLNVLLLLLFFIVHQNINCTSGGLNARGSLSSSQPEATVRAVTSADLTARGGYPSRGRISNTWSVISKDRPWRSRTTSATISTAMEEPPKNQLLQVKKEEFVAVRKAVNLDSVDNINRDIDMVIDWYKKQQHLPRIKLDRRIVERILISRKGSVEQTKQKLDMMFTLRTLIPDLAAPRDIQHPDIQRQFKAAIFTAMPKLNDDLTRINIYKYTKDVDNFVLADTLKYMIMTIEYRLQNDYCSGDRYILDFGESTLSHLTKQSPLVMKNTEIFLTKACSIRIFGMHFINAPSFIGKIVMLFKGALSSKLGARIMVHPDYEDLHKYISTRVLPKDYGGEEGPMEQYSEEWKRELSKEENRKFLILQESLRSDESLRIGQRDSDDILGIPGSFKRLNVD